MFPLRFLPLLLGLAAAGCATSEPPRPRAGLAADPELARPFVERLWTAPIPSGRWRYDNGLLYFLSLLQTGGHFHIYAPAPP